MKELGVEIQNARLEKGINLEEIARQTHIQLSHLQKIENGQFDFLPRPYVVAFIKTFAQAVGLNGEALVQRWHEHEQTEASRQPQPMPAQKKSAGRPAPSTLVSLKPKALATTNAASIPLAIPYLKEIAIGFGMILVMAALVFIMSRAGDDAQTPNIGAQTTQREEPTKLEEIPFERVTQQAQQLAEPKPELQAPPPSNELILQVQFENQTRLRVVIDGKDTTFVTHRRGESKTWQAKEKFNLRLSANGSVILTLGGKNLGTFGQPGKIGYLTITRDGVSEPRWITPKPPAPRSAVPLDSLSIRRPRELN